MKAGYTKPPPGKNTSLNQGNKSGQPPLPPGKAVDYTAIAKKNEWLEQHAGEVKDLLGLDLSGTFEQMEMLVKAQYKDYTSNQANQSETVPISLPFTPILEADSMAQDSLDLTELGYQQRHQAHQIKPPSDSMKHHQHSTPPVTTTAQQPLSSKQQKQPPTSSNNQPNSKTKAGPKNTGSSTLTSAAVVSGTRSHPQYFDCDVSEIARNNKTLNEDSRYSNALTNKLSSNNTT